MALAAGPARADHAVAIYVEGVGPAEVRAAVAAGLPEGLRVLAEGPFAATLKAEGQRLPLGPALYDAKRRKALVARLRNAAAAAGADAVVTALSFKKGAKRIVALSWIEPRSQAPLALGALRLSGDGKADRAAVVAVIGKAADALAGQAPAVAAAPAPRPADAPRPAAASQPAPRPAVASQPAIAAASPPAPGPAVAAAPPDAAAAPAPVEPAAGPAVAAPRSPLLDPARRRRHDVDTALVIGDLGFDVGGRRFTYNDPITRNLPDYAVFGAPLISFAAQIYPAALTRLPVLRDLGLTAHVSHALGLSSETAGGTPVSTDWTRAGGGLRYRLAPPWARGVMAGLSLGVESSSFRLDAGGELAKVVASVSYLSVRVGLDARVPFWRMALLLEWAYDAPVSSGDVSDRFREPSVGGIDLGGGLAFVIGAGFQVNVRARYERYFYAFHPVPGDGYVAGGALDELFTFGGGVTYVY